MGMSASQVNLLSLTARLHDIEYKAQNIMSEKVALATQQDEVYQNYLRSLDAKKVQVAFNNGTDGKQFVDATFTNVCTYNENRYQNYSLKDMRTGKLFVTEDMYNAYNRSSDKYNFAWDMLNLVEDSGANWDRNVSVPEGLPENTIPELTDAEFLTLIDNIGGNLTIDEMVEAYKNNGSLFEGKIDENIKTALVSYFEKNFTEEDLKILNNGVETNAKKIANEMVNNKDKYKNVIENAKTIVQNELNDVIKNSIKSYINDNFDKNLRAMYEEYMSADDKDKAKIANDIKQILYTQYQTQIYNYMRVPKTQDDYYKPEDAEKFNDKLYGSDDFPENEFNYYVQMWENINASGGCIIVPASANAGDEANKWFNDMVSSGKAIICTYNETTKGWDEQTVANTISGNYLIENQDDKDLKKAEAEYEYNLNIIKKKDSEFDKSLSKLETEKSSIEQMMESIKTAKNENIDRTFNLFN